MAKHEKLPEPIYGHSSGEPPSEMDKRRDMIKTAVDAAASGVMEDIKALRKQLDDLESLVVQNAARVSENLNTHVSICESAQIEVKRLAGLVTEMRQTQMRGAADPVEPRH